VIDRRIRRLQKSKKSSNFPDSSSESDDEYHRINQHDQNTNTINHNSPSEFQENLNSYDNYHDDEYNNTDDLNGVHYDAWDHSPPPLYNGCRLSIMKSVESLSLITTGNFSFNLFGLVFNHSTSDQRHFYICIISVVSNLKVEFNLQIYFKLKT
jgi:hypothetical protein